MLGLLVKKVGKIVAKADEEKLKKMLGNSNEHKFDNPPKWFWQKCDENRHCDKAGHDKNWVWKKPRMSFLFGQERKFKP